MAVNKLVTVQIDSIARDRLGQIAVAYERSMTKQMQWMIYQEWVRLFGQVNGAEIVGVEELPGPTGSASVPVIMVQRDGEPERIPDEQP